MRVTGSHKLFIFQAMAHLSVIPMILWGQPKHYLWALLVYFFTGCVGMTMTIHRKLSHNSWKEPRWLQNFGTFCATIGLTGSPLAWAAIHRQHHHYADKEGDPHSPIVHSHFFAQYLSMFPKPNLKYVKDLLKDPAQRFFHRRYYFVNLVYAATLIVIDPFAVVYAYLFPAAVLWNAGSAINTIGHTFGYRNHKVDDHSKNNFILGYITWGEGWHNNHHNSPSRWHYGEKWWELDTAGEIIRLFRFFQRKSKRTA